MSVFVFHPMSHDEFSTDLLEVSEASRPVESESETSPHEAILCPIFSLMQSQSTALFDRNFYHKLPIYSVIARHKVSGCRGK